MKEISKKKLFTIGELSKLLNISPKTLRFYDNIGLIRPEERDPNNGYRYYSIYQIPQIIQTIEYKSMGINLNDVKERFEYGNDPYKVSEFLEKQVTIAENKIAKLEKSIDIHRKKIKNIEEDMAYSLNKSFYWRYIEERYVVMKEYKKRERENICALINFYKIYDYLIKNEMYTPHEAGFFVNFTKFDKNPLFYSYQYFNILKDKTIDDRNYRIIPSGRFLCINYTSESKLVQIQAIKNYLKQKNFEPLLCLEREMNTSVINFENPQYELQLYFDKY